MRRDLRLAIPLGVLGATLIGLVLGASVVEQYRRVDAGQSHPVVGPVDRSNAEQPITLTGTTNIPLLPGARLASGATLDLPNSGEYFFYIDEVGTMEEMVQFYKKYMASAGWTLLDEHLSDEVSYLDYSFTKVGDAANKPPSRMWMRVGLQSRMDVLREVYIWFKPWPEPDTVPVPPNASNLERSRDTSSPLAPAGVTSFNINLQPADVESFYVRELPQYGWALLPDLSTPGTKLQFMGKGSRVTLEMNRLSGSETGVVVTVWGVDVGSTSLAP